MRSCRLALLLAAQAQALAGLVNLHAEEPSLFIGDGTKIIEEVRVFDSSLRVEKL
jgi:hypothetical protein